MAGPISALYRQLLAGDVVLGIVLVLVATWATYHALCLAGVLSRSTIGDRYSQFASQVGTLLSLEQAYEFTRGQIPYRTDIAFINAYRLLDLELRHGFFIESRLERFFLQFQTLMNVIEGFYVFGHLFVTVGVVVWIYVRRRPHYAFLRNMLVVTTAMALVAFYLYPTAPPRMLSNYGLVDPLQLHQFVSAGGAQADSYTYNPYAAMPSLHVAYALIVGFCLLLAERRWWIKIVASLYPLLMAATVVISGNHWVLDVAGAVVTVALAGVLVLGVSYLQTALLPRVVRGSRVARYLNPPRRSECGDRL